MGCLELCNFTRRHCTQNKNIIENFIQYDLWKNTMNEFEIKDSNNTVLSPLNLFYDDTQLANALVAHTTGNKIGAMYDIILCLRPEFEKVC